MAINLSRSSVRSTVSTPQRTASRSSVSSKVIMAPSTKTASWMGIKTFPPSPVKLSGTGGARLSLGGKSPVSINVSYNPKSTTQTPVRPVKSMMPGMVKQLPTQITRTATSVINSPFDALRYSMLPDKIASAPRPIKSMMSGMKPKVITPVRPVSSTGSGGSGSSSGSNSPYYAFVRSPGATGVTKQTFITRAAQTSYVNQQVKSGNIIAGAN